MDAEKVIKSSVELGLLNESDVPACSRFLAGAIGTDEIIEKLQIFKFGEHYRLLEKVENEDTKSFLSDYSEPSSSSIAERISCDTGTVKILRRAVPTFVLKIDVPGRPVPVLARKYDRKLQRGERMGVVPVLRFKLYFNSEKSILLQAVILA